MKTTDELVKKCFRVCAGCVIRVDDWQLLARAAQRFVRLEQKQKLKRMEKDYWEWSKERKRR